MTAKIKLLLLIYICICVCGFDDVLIGDQCGEVEDRAKDWLFDAVI